MPAITERVVENELLSAYCEIKAAGTKIPDKYRDNLVTAEVQQSLHIPSMFVLRFYALDMQNPTIKLDLLDESPFEVGKEIEVSMGQDKNSLLSVITGEITGLELDLEFDTIPVMTVRGYEKTHRLNRGRKTRTFLQVSDSDVFSTVAKECGLSANATSTSPVYKFIMQNNETNYEFLRRRAYRIGMEMYVDGNTLKLRTRSTEETTVTVEWGVNLLYLNHRLSATEQVDEVLVRGWDPAKKEAIVGTANTSDNHPAIGESKTGKQMASRFGAAKVAAVSRPVFNQSEAEKLAKAIYDDISGRFIQMEGACYGDTKLKPGKKVELKGIGTKLSGKYYLSSCTHTYNTIKGSYTTNFEASGRQANTFLELTNQSASGHHEVIPGPVIGVVTNNKDEEGKQGRVKVKFPWLPQNEGKDIEGDWARIAAPMAGADRGFFFLPEVNDEVLVAFEHGDINRPYVLGVLWNGKDAPPEQVSKVLASDGKVNQRILKTRAGHIVTFDDSDDKPGITIIDKTGKNKITIDSKENTISVESDKDIELKATKGKILLDAKDVEIKGSNSVKVTGKTVNVEGQQTVEIKGNQSAKLSGTQVEIVGNASAKINGGAMTEIKGGVIKLN